MIRRAAGPECGSAGFRRGSGKDVSSVRGVVAALSAASIVVFACGGGGGGPGSGAAADLGPAVEANEVTVEGQKFGPASIVVKVGTEVHWSNKDRTSHTVTSGAPEGKTGFFDRTLGPGFGELRFTFDKAGVYPYYCQFHTTMRGQVEVK